MRGFPLSADHSSPVLLGETAAVPCFWHNAILVLPTRRRRGRRGAKRMPTLGGNMGAARRPSLPASRSNAALNRHLCVPFVRCNATAAAPSTKPALSWRSDRAGTAATCPAASTGHTVWPPPITHPASDSSCRRHSSLRVVRPHYRLPFTRLCVMQSIWQFLAELPPPLLHAET